MIRRALFVFVCCFCLCGRGDTASDVSSILSLVRTLEVNLRNCIATIGDIIDVYYDEVLPQLEDIESWVEEIDDQLMDDLVPDIEDIRLRIRDINTQLQTFLTTHIQQIYYNQEQLIDFSSSTSADVNEILTTLNSCYYSVSMIDNATSQMMMLLSDLYQSFNSVFQDSDFSNLPENVDDLLTTQRAIADYVEAIAIGMEGVIQLDETMDFIKSWLNSTGTLISTNVGKIEGYTYHLDDMLTDAFTGSAIGSARFYTLMGAPWLNGLTQNLPQTQVLQIQAGDSGISILTDMGQILSGILDGNAANNELLLYMCMALTKSNLNPENNEDIQSRQTDFQSALGSYQSDATSAQQQIDDLRFPTLDVGNAFDASHYVQSLRPYARNTLDVNTLTLGGFSTFNGLEDISATLDLGSFSTFFSGVRFAFGLVYWGLLVGFLVFVFRWFGKVQKLLWSFLYNN